MNILYCLRIRTLNPVFDPIKVYRRTIYRASQQITSSKSQSKPIAPISKSFTIHRNFMKKVGLEPLYDNYKKRAIKDNISSNEFELIYNGIGETYARCLSGIVISALILLPTVFTGAYLYLLISEGSINLKTYFEILLLPHSAIEVFLLLTTMFSLKLASYSFISKYVVRIYKHNIKPQYACVYINPILPWKNITVMTDKAIKLPNGKISLVPWYKEYYELGGYKSIVLKERFRRPIDIDRMTNTEEKTKFD
ncbi:uncharacterized protein LOC126840368 [Adelges cooleyi]|uniref:uncharacterized protein LOC126840368 n=1 Tax=Adelges cooleyi TaxID=133065 RepID=UPI0021801DC9|nr:uncharacterized protein LOC126840368 [Adelges cooleyi]